MGRPSTLWIVVVCLFVANVAAAQTSIGFRNAMQSAADVVITAAGSTAPVQFAIGANNVVNFNFGEAAVFNIQVIPRDAPDSGFRFSNVNLRDLATESIDGILTLDGEFAADQQRFVCRRIGLLGLRRCCYWSKTRGERIAVDLTGNLRNGESFNLLSPKMTYQAVMEPF